jgi:hypothetical protein
MVSPIRAGGVETLVAEIDADELCQMTTSAILEVGSLAISKKAIATA